MTGPERRRAPRVATRLPLTIRDKQEGFIARTKNISASGAYCTLRRALAPMTKLQVRLQLPGRPKPKPIACQGVVVRVEPAGDTPPPSRYHVAIFFRELADHDRAMLADFVQRQLRQHPSPR